MQILATVRTLLYFKPESDVHVTSMMIFIHLRRPQIQSLSKRLPRRLYQHYCLSCLCLFSAPEILLPDADERNTGAKNLASIYGAISGSCVMGFMEVVLASTIQEGFKGLSSYCVFITYTLGSLHPGILV